MIHESECEDERLQQDAVPFDEEQLAILEE